MNLLKEILLRVFTFGPKKKKWKIYCKYSANFDRFILLKLKRKQNVGLEAPMNNDLPINTIDVES